MSWTIIDDRKVLLWIKQTTACSSAKDRFEDCKHLDNDDSDDLKNTGELHVNNGLLENNCNLGDSEDLGTGGCSNFTRRLHQFKELFQANAKEAGFYIGANL